MTLREFRENVGTVGPVVHPIECVNRPRQPASPQPGSSGDDPLAQLPDGWLRDIRLNEGVEVPLPPFDAAGHAKAHFHRGRQRRVFAWSTASAAAIALGFSLWAWRWGPGARSLRAVPPASVAASGDINGDGSITMIDALLLANAVHTGNADLRFDVNADRVVDANDVDQLASAAVRLDGAHL